MFNNEGFLDSFVNLVTWTSLDRIWRAKYIARNMIFGLIMSVCSSIVSWLWAALESSGLDWIAYVLLWLPLVFFSIYWSVYLNNKRFHDRWSSWWWQLLFFIPIVNFFVAIYLWFFPWDKWWNEYWEQAETQTREKILAWILPILVIFIIVWILSAALLPRLQWAQSRAKDVARKTHLSQIQSAIVTYQGDKWMWPHQDDAMNWIPVSNIASDLNNAWLIDVPKDPTLTNKNSWLWNAISDGEYLYLVATRNSIPNWWFVLMAKTEMEWGSNWVVCDNNQWKITAETDLADIKICDTVSEWESCSNSNGACTYTSPDQLRYIIVY